MKETNVFPRHYFTRYDESDDYHFYSCPRLTAHIDDDAIKAVGRLFSEILPLNGVVLDLMSSYRSHIPAELPISRMIGLGLNAEEMRRNPQLDEFIIHDVNRDPHLPFDNASFDGALCTVSVQYLTRPVEVFAEIGRVLRPRAPFIVTFSNRCFPSKAVRVWMSTSDAQHMQLVEMYFTYAGCFDQIQVFDRSPRPWVSDPLYAAVGRRVV